MGYADDNDEDDHVSARTRDLAADAMIRAANSPQPSEIGALAARALAGERDMTPAEIRQLAAVSLTQAQRVSQLMIRLADLLDAGGTPAAGGGARG